MAQAIQAFSSEIGSHFLLEKCDVAQAVYPEWGILCVLILDRDQEKGHSVHILEIPYLLVFSLPFPYTVCGLEALAKMYRGGDLPSDLHDIGHLAEQVVFFGVGSSVPVPTRIRDFMDPRGGKSAPIRPADRRVWEPGEAFPDQPEPTIELSFSLEAPDDTEPI